MKSAKIDLIGQPPPSHLISQLQQTVAVKKKGAGSCVCVCADEANFGVVGESVVINQKKIYTYISNWE